MRGRRHWRTALAALTALAILAAGCGRTTHKTVGPSGTGGAGNLLVFATSRNAGGTGEWDVGLYDIDAAALRTLAGLNSSSVQGEPCISDDGAFVAFASNRPNGEGGWDLYLYDRTAQGLVAQPGLNSAADETWPRFTHDAVHLAFVRDSAGVHRIRLYEPRGDTLVALPGLAATGGASDAAPAPDLHGDAIAFESSRLGDSLHVFLWRRGHGVLAIPALVGDSADVEPSLSSDGRWLAFASNRSGGAGGWDVMLYDLVAGAFVPLPGCNTAGDERHPGVSADGRTLVFASRTDASHRWSLWRYSLASGTRSQPAGLAAGNGDDVQPCLLMP